MKCIFCDVENTSKSIEHIVPESLGNKKYVMQKGEVCDFCNARFSKFEDKALSNSVLAMERARFAIKTKKGKNVKGKINTLVIEGDDDFRQTYLKISGKVPEFVRSYNHITGNGELEIPAFYKSEAAVCKLALKIGLESIYKSQKSIFAKYDFRDLKNYLTTKCNTDWPFVTSDYEILEFISIPKYHDKYLLKMNHCSLRLLELNYKTLLFKFKYGGIAITLNLLNRDLKWSLDILVHDRSAIIYQKVNR